MLLTACLGRSPDSEPTIETRYQEQNIPIQEQPKAVYFPPVGWFVITEDNLDNKLAEIDAKTGNIVLFTVTPKGYENLSIGIAELRRYIRDQQAVIAYYEDAIRDYKPPAEEK